MGDLEVCLLIKVAGGLSLIGPETAAEFESKNVMEAAKPIYGDAINVAVWVKSKADEGCIYRNQHEFIGVFRTGKTPRGNIETGRRKRSRSNVWHYPAVNSFCGIDELGAHPTAKPVALIADAIKDCTNKGDIVLDNAHEYAAKLRDDGMVIADFEARRAQIEQSLRDAAERDD